MESKDYCLDVEEIKKILPHRYPFLLVDRVLSISDPTQPGSRVGKKAIALKNVTTNESFFNGHFPQRSIMPGVLLIEAMAQAGGLACFDPADGPVDIRIAKVKEARFRHPVVPGDQVLLEALVVKDKGRVLGIHCKALVSETVVAECEVLAHVTKERDGV